MEALKAGELCSSKIIARTRALCGRCPPTDYPLRMNKPLVVRFIGTNPTWKQSFVLRSQGLRRCMRNSLFVAVIVVGLSVGDSFGSAVFIPVTQDTSQGDGEGMDISDDGRFVAGTAVTGGVREAYRFEIGVGVTMLGDISGGMTLSLGLGMSADGSVVVGRSWSATGPVWFRWTPSGGMINLGDANFANDVSADGSIIVGNSRNGKAMIWSAETSIIEMGPSLGFQAKEALGVSRDGTAAVGFGADPLGSGFDVPFIWNEGAGFTIPPLAPNARHTLGFRISDDHSVMAGYSWMQSGGDRPFRWTLDGGYQFLGTLPGSSPATSLWTTDMSGDGRIIVGRENGGRGFIWEEGVGMKPASEYLASFGIDIPNINYVGAVSRDGTIFAGTTQSGQTFVATVPELGTAFFFAICSICILGRRPARR